MTKKDGKEFENQDKSEARQHVNISNKSKDGDEKLFLKKSQTCQHVNIFYKKKKNRENHLKLIATFNVRFTSNHEAQFFQLQISKSYYHIKHE